MDRTGNGNNNGIIWTAEHNERFWAERRRIQNERRIERERVQTEWNRFRAERQLERARRVAQEEENRRAVRAGSPAPNPAPVAAPAPARGQFRIIRNVERNPRQNDDDVSSASDGDSSEDEEVQMAADEHMRNLGLDLREESRVNGDLERKRLADAQKEFNEAQIETFQKKKEIEKKKKKLLEKEELLLDVRISNKQLEIGLEKGVMEQNKQKLAAHEAELFEIREKRILLEIEEEQRKIEAIQSGGASTSHMAPAPSLAPTAPALAPGPSSPLAPAPNNQSRKRPEPIPMDEAGTSGASGRRRPRTTRN